MDGEEVDGVGSDPTSGASSEPESELEHEHERALALDIEQLADAIESIGFECTRCGACCTSHGDERDQEHTATIFPDEVRTLQDSDDEWRDVARPIPYGLSEGPDGLEGETFEWALQTDSCGDCAFYTETDGTGECTAHKNRPLICQTYPFSVALSGTSQPMGEVVDRRSVSSRTQSGDSEEFHSSGSRAKLGDREGLNPSSSRAKLGDSEEVRAHECEGLGREISREDALSLATALKERAVRELEEAIAVRDAYEPTRPADGEIVVHDSEGAKHPDGTLR